MRWYVCMSKSQKYFERLILQDRFWFVHATFRNRLKLQFFGTISCGLPHSLIVILLLWEFFTPALADSLQLEFEQQQVSRTLLSIPADQNNAVVWMVSSGPQISDSFSLSYQAFGDCSERTSYNWLHCHLQFPKIFSSQVRSMYLSSLFTFFYFTLWFVSKAKSTIR